MEHRADGRPGPAVSEGDGRRGGDRDGDPGRRRADGTDGRWWSASTGSGDATAVDFDAGGVVHDHDRGPGAGRHGHVHADARRTTRSTRCRRDADGVRLGGPGGDFDRGSADGRRRDVDGDHADGGPGHRFRRLGRRGGDGDGDAGRRSARTGPTDETSMGIAARRSTRPLWTSRRLGVVHGGDGRRPSRLDGTGTLTLTPEDDGGGGAGRNADGSPAIGGPGGGLRRRFC